MMSAGMLLGGRYRLNNRLAYGGMAEVWDGVDERLHRPVAVKLLSARLATDDAYRRRFRQEARTVGRLSHPGIAAMYDYGEAVPVPAGQQPGAFSSPTEPVFYLVMELVVGRTLAEVLAEGGALGSDRTLDLIAQAARALEAAHRCGVVHRDVKPANLMVTPQGQVKVTDFGISRPWDHEPLTATGQVVGTPEYLAPELSRGEAATRMSDIYALGIVAYECLAGRRPFSGANQIAIVTAHVDQEPPPLPQTLSEGVVSAVMTALQKDPAQRFPSAGRFADVLEELRARRGSGSGGPRRTGPGNAGTTVLSSAPQPTAPRGMPGPRGQRLRGHDRSPGMAPGTAPAAARGRMAAGALTATPVSGMPLVAESRDLLVPPRHGGGNRRLLTVAAVVVIGVVGLAGYRPGTALLGRVLPSSAQTTGTGGDTTGNGTGTGTATGLAVPPLVGLQEQAAESRLAELGLTWTVAQRSSDQYDTGHVAEQNPQAGASVAAGSSVVLTVSSGKASQQVPDETGRSVAQATRDLQARGFSVRRVAGADSPDVPRGRVVRTSPAAGTAKQPGTRVTLYVSTGLVDVPDVRGRQITDALQVLQGELKLRVTVQSQASNQQVGTVLAQDVRNTDLRQGGRVRLIVAAAPVTVPNGSFGGGVVAPPHW